MQAPKEKWFFNKFWFWLIVVFMMLFIFVPMKETVYEYQTVCENCENVQAEAAFKQQELQAKLDAIEAEAARQEAEIEAKKIEAPVTIEYCGWEKDFEGSVDLTFKMKNNTKKSIKEWGFEIAYLDGNGNLLYDIGDYSNFKTPYQQYTWDPWSDWVDKNETEKLLVYGFDNPNFNGEIVFRSIFIVYEDGTTDFLDLTRNEYKNLFK